MRNPFIRTGEMLITLVKWNDGTKTIAEMPFGKEMSIDEVVALVSDFDGTYAIHRVEGNKVEDVTAELAEYVCSQAECREEVGDWEWVQEYRDALPSEDSFNSLPHPNYEHRLTASDYGIGGV